MTGKGKNRYLAGYFLWAFIPMVVLVVVSTFFHSYVEMMNSQKNALQDSKLYHQFLVHHVLPQAGVLLLAAIASAVIARVLIQRRDAEKGIQALFQSAVGTTGQDCFDRIVMSICECLHCDFALIGELVDSSEMKALAMQSDGALRRGDHYPIAHTPSQIVLAEGKVFYRLNARKIFPMDENLLKIGAEGFAGVALRGINGRPIGVLVVASRQRITPSSRTEQVLDILASRASAEIQRFRAEEELTKISRAVEQSPATVVITDTKGSIEYVNPMFTSITGYTFQEALGKNPRVLKSGHQDAEFYEDLWSTISGGGTWTGEFLNKRRDGTLYWEHASISPVRNQAGTITHYVAVKEDITERKKLLEDLERSKDDLDLRVQERTAELAASNQTLLLEIAERKRVQTELAEERLNLELTVQMRTRQLQQSLKEVEAANQHKSRFLSSMSHELRTPLNAILGFSDLLGGEFYGPLNDKQKGYVKHVNISGRNLLELINDILDVTKIDAGVVELKIEDVSARDCIESTVESLRTQFDSKDLNVVIEIAPTLEYITCDRRRFRQILLNLLSNAIKYTSQSGNVLVQAIREAKNYARIIVSDTGVGIEQEFLNKIFTEFYQVRRERDEALGGTGIGLALTQRLVELHGGEIGVESEVGTGSTFWFRLPLNPEGTPDQKPEEIDQPTWNLSGRRILVTEDNSVNQALLRSALQTQGVEVIVAHNGREAVELTRIYHPDMILMDIRMPVMDGIEATEIIHGDPNFAKTPIIALTASVDDEMKERCLVVGCCAYVPKPIQLRVLFSAIQEHLPA